MSLVKRDGKSALDRLRGQKEIAEQIASGTTIGKEALVLCIDGSASMSSEDKWSAAVRASLELVKDSVLSEVGIVVFDHTILGAREIGTSTSNIKDFLATQGPNGGTCLATGLCRAKPMFDAFSSRPVKRIVLLSDGYDGKHAGADALDRIVDELVALHIVLDTVGFGTGCDEQLLRNIAERTGGVYRHASDAKSLVREFKRLEAGLRGLLAKGSP